MQDQAFTDDFRTQFDLLMRLRRDVRRFRTDAIDEAVLTRCLSRRADQFSFPGFFHPESLIRLQREMLPDSL